MPSVMHVSSPTPSLGKKRRRDEYHAEDAEGRSAAVQMPLCAPLPLDTEPRPFEASSAADLAPVYSLTPSHAAVMQNASIASLQRKIKPLAPPSKRTRVFADDHENRDPTCDWQSQGGHHHGHHHADYSTPPMSPQVREPPRFATSGRTGTPAPLLSPCHICHRKPTRKTDLDSFADCEGCGQRTCYVCIRQCQGWLGDDMGEGPRYRRGRTAPWEEEKDDIRPRSFTMRDVDDDDDYDDAARDEDPPRDKDTGWDADGHCSVVCSGCCVERGSEGDVVCLGCLGRMPPGVRRYGPL